MAEEAPKENHRGYALVKWVYRAASGRRVCIRQWHPSDTTPKAILTRQDAGLPYTKFSLVTVDAQGAEYANLHPGDEQTVSDQARLAQQHVDIMARYQ